ncbi:hypothetical protein BDQ94DRAFT_154009 [Aspergillus welwitschiae]|uniref:Uncharacterized protein n=2 Tax=Aspergillus subgen. Circumdati TaxID=2720871 RepID=A0A3F3PK67_9EURO|nr:hypothetical protein BDQ94DRAFT_154009 [Aspergillus welwitschiae]RDH27344.1 hypothetical protein BDQ94DRAFT_154009 [Aspergillus welwitschiae]
MVGSIFNVLPRRFRLSAGSSFLETLEWSQKNTLEDKSHQFCSLVDLEDLLLPGNQNQPLFNTCFSVESALSNGTGKLSFRPIETHEETHVCTWAIELLADNADVAGLERYTCCCDRSAGQD